MADSCDAPLVSLVTEQDTVVARVVARCDRQPGHIGPHRGSRVVGAVGREVWWPVPAVDDEPYDGPEPDDYGDDGAAEHAYEKWLWSLGEHGP